MRLRHITLWCLLFFSGVSHANHTSYKHAVCVSHVPLITDLASSNLSLDVEILSNSLYDTLVSLDEEGFARPQLAESWEVLEGGLLYRFRLRQGVAFHTLHGFKPSRPLNASDVVFTLNRLLDPEAYFAKTDDKIAFATVFPHGNIASVTGSGLNVDIRLKVPDVELVEKLSAYDTSILSLEYAQFLDGAKKENLFTTESVGTGPFKYESSSKNTFILARFDQHWGGVVGLAGLVFKAERGDLDRLSRLRRGDCSQALELGSRLLDLKNNFEGYVVQRAPILSVLFLAIDTRIAPWDDLRARKALSLAINRERILRLLFKSGSGEHASTSIHPRLLGLPRAERLEYDPHRAMRLLELVAGGKPLSLKISSFDVARPHNPKPRRMAQLVAQDLESVGLDVTIEWVPIENLMDVVGNAESSLYEGLLMGYSADAPLASYMVELLLGCSDSRPRDMNFSRMCDPQIGAMIEKASLETDAHKRQQLYRGVANASLAKMQYVNLLHAEHVDVVREDVVGIRRRSNGVFDFRDAEKRHRH